MKPIIKQYSKTVEVGKECHIDADEDCDMTVSGESCISYEYDEEDMCYYVTGEQEGKAVFTINLGNGTIKVYTVWVVPQKVETPKPTATPEPTKVPGPTAVPEDR